jgi:hypothetical protein
MEGRQESCSLANRGNARKGKPRGRRRQDFRPLLGARFPLANPHGQAEN